VAALLHTTREVVIVIALTIAFFYAARPTEIVVLSPSLLLSGMAVTIMALQKKALQDRLSAAAKQSVMFRSEAEHAREAERQRMAADFHDGPLQSFVGLQMRLEVVRKLLERDPKLAMDEITQLQELSKMQAAELRAFVRSMRPVEVDGAGLVPSLRKLVEGFGKESGISASFVGGNTRVSPDSQSSLEILQIVREALHNVQKHSKASRVTVGVGREGNTFELSIEDDGTGFPFSGAYTLEELDLLRLGPISIRRRVRILGGEMMLDSQPGKGASLKIRVPV
jgi:signal transduction histidine kinase